jgi:hypothetical protein
MNTPDLPPVSDAHRQAAFVAMGWRGWTYTAALADPTRSRVLECRAAQIRTKEWMATQQRTVAHVRRCRPGADGHPTRWCTQTVAGSFEPRLQPDFLQTTSNDQS